MAQKTPIPLLLRWRHLLTRLPRRSHGVRHNEPTDVRPARDLPARHRRGELTSVPGRIPKLARARLRVEGHRDMVPDVRVEAGPRRGGQQHVLRPGVRAAMQRPDRGGVVCPREARAGCAWWLGCLSASCVVSVECSFSLSLYLLSLFFYGGLIFFWAHVQGSIGCLRVYGQLHVQRQLVILTNGACYGHGIEMRGLRCRRLERRGRQAVEGWYEKRRAREIRIMNATGTGREHTNITSKARTFE